MSGAASIGKHTTPTRENATELAKVAHVTKIALVIILNPALGLPDSKAHVEFAEYTFIIGSWHGSCMGRLQVSFLVVGWNKKYTWHIARLALVGV